MIKDNEDHQLTQVMESLSQKLPAQTKTLVLGITIGLVATVAGLILALGGPLAAVASLLAVIASLVVLRDLDFGFLGIICVVTILPFGTIPVDIGLTPTFLDIVLAATAGVWSLKIVTGRQRRVISSPITLPLLVFVMVAIFSFIFGLSNGPLTPNLLRHFAELLLSISFVLIITDQFSDWERLSKIVKSIIIAGTGAALIAIVIWALPEDTANGTLNALQRVGYPGGFVIRYIEENPELSERAIGTSVDPNALGGLLLMIAALTAPQMVSRKPLLPKWFVFTAFALLFVALTLTFSRGALAGLAGGLGFIAVARYRRLLPYLGVGALLFMLLPVTQGYVARLLEGLMGQDLATQMRFGEYQDALTLISRYPLFGVGFAGSPDIDLYLGVANVYLTIGQQMGFLGLIAFLAVVITLLAYAFFAQGKLKKQENLDAVWLGLHAAIIGGLIAGIFDHYLFNIDFHHAVTIFWFLFGLSAAATKIGIERESAPQLLEAAGGKSSF